MSYQQLYIEELVTLCQKQNQKAQFEVYNRYCKAMYNVAFRIVKDEHFAEDVMQESFLKAFTKIDSYKKEVAFGAWLKRIVINYSIDFCKKNNKLKSDDFEKNLYKIEDKEAEFTEVINFDEIKVKEVYYKRFIEGKRLGNFWFFVDDEDKENIKRGRTKNKRNHQ